MAAALDVGQMIIEVILINGLFGDTIIDDLEWAMNHLDPSNNSKYRSLIGENKFL